MWPEHKYRNIFINLSLQTLTLLLSSLIFLHACTVGSIFCLLTHCTVGCIYRMSQKTLQRFYLNFKSLECFLGHPVHHKFISCFHPGCCLVDGLPLTEFRILGEKCSTSPDMRDEKNRRMEFPTNTITVLNSLEMMGYKVVTSGAFSGSSFGTFSHKEFIWTLHRSSNDIDHL